MARAPNVRSLVYFYSVRYDPSVLPVAIYQRDFGVAEVRAFHCDCSVAGESDPRAVGPVKPSGTCRAARHVLGDRDRALRTRLPWVF